MPNARHIPDPTAIERHFYELLLHRRRTAPIGITAYERPATLYSVLVGSLVRSLSFADIIRSQKINLLLSIDSLYRICPEVLQAPRVGAFNLHPSILPRYAGLNDPAWAVFYE